MCIIIMWDLLLFLPCAITYGLLFMFIGYVIDPLHRNEGAWYGDIMSTIGLALGIVFAWWLVYA